MGLDDECINCCKKFDGTLCVSEILIDSSLESSSMSASGDNESKWKKIKVSQVLSSLFNRPIIEDEKFAVCSDCAFSLKIGYQQLKSWQFQFNQRRQEQSFLANKIRPQNSDLLQIQIPPPPIQANDNSRGSTYINFRSQIEMNHENEEGQGGSTECPENENINLNDLTNTGEGDGPEVEDGWEVVSSSGETGPHSVRIDSDSENKNIEGHEIDKNESPQDFFMEEGKNTLANDEKDEQAEDNEQEQEQQLFLEPDPIPDDQVTENENEEIEIIKDNLTCSICPNRFLNLCDLTRHLIDAHVEEGSSKCPICDETFARPYFKEHLMIHTGYRPHRCSHGGCSITTIKRRELTRHVERAHGNDGQDGTVSSSGAVKRERVDDGTIQPDSSGGSPVIKRKCPLCPRKFNTLEILGQHIFDDHTTSLKCPVCTFTSFKRGPLKVHIMANHGGGFRRDSKSLRLSQSPDSPVTSKSCSRPSGMKIHPRSPMGE